MFCKICESNIGQIIAPSQIIPPDPASSPSLPTQQQCAFCLGLLCDPDLMDQMAEKAAQQFVADKFDGTDFILALNMPITQVLREVIVEKMSASIGSEHKWAPALMSPKELLAQCLMPKIAKRTGLRPSLKSNLILTITLESDEFFHTDLDFIQQSFPGELNGGENNKKRKHRNRNKHWINNNGNEFEQYSVLTKQKVRSLGTQMSGEGPSQFLCRKSAHFLIFPIISGRYKMLPATKCCTFSVTFEREPVFIAGRYCKFSRALPQSAWGPDSDAPTGESVGEKLSTVFEHHFGATSSRFSASGREDVDVRMLGTGRPFVVQLLNAHRTSELRSVESAGVILHRLARQINTSERDVAINSMAQVSAKQAQVLNVGQEEKRKTYSALCYAKVPLSEEHFNRLKHCFPVELVQKTAIRVLKRRPLLDRTRNIYWMQARQLDAFHFLLRLQTQAGTYVKEFVHSDFGRTRPCLATLMGLELGQLDILELDVLEVDLEWPPPSA